MLDFPHFHRKTGDATVRFHLLSRASRDILSGTKWKKVVKRVKLYRLWVDSKAKGPEKRVFGEIPVRLKCFVAITQRALMRRAG